MRGAHQYFDCSASSLITPPNFGSGAGAATQRNTATNAEGKIANQDFRLAAGPGFRPSQIWFEGEPPAYADRLSALAEHGVSFGHSHTSLVFSRRLLVLPLPKAQPLREVRASAPLPSADPVTSLRQAIAALLQRGRVDVRDAAELSGQSVRSFQRSLKRAGLRFAELLEEQRFLAARRLLADRERRVIDVAVALGYTDSANFTRAFRRWAGLSPQAFRRAAHDALAARWAG